MNIAAQTYIDRAGDIVILIPSDVLLWTQAELFEMFLASFAGREMIDSRVGRKEHRKGSI